MPAADAGGSRVANPSGDLEISTPRVARIAETLDEARRRWLEDRDDRSLRRRLLTVLQQLDEPDE